jgi:hypothetical protein
MGSCSLMTNLNNLEEELRMAIGLQLLTETLLPFIKPLNVTVLLFMHQRSLREKKQLRFKKKVSKKEKISE